MSGISEFQPSDEKNLITAFRWGVVRPEVRSGKLVSVSPFEFDRSPSPVLPSLAELPYCDARIRYPMVREGYLKEGPASRERRGLERWVRVSWDEALELVSGEIRRVYGAYGPSSVYASSYGWHSSGKVVDAPACMKRLFALMGGFIGRTNTYSTAAIGTILPYVLGEKEPKSTAWDAVLENSERVVFWGCDPLVTNDVDWHTTLHESADALRALKRKGTKTISVNPIRTDSAEYFGSGWIALNPGTDCALMASMIFELETSGEADHAFLEKYTSGWEELRAYVTGVEDGVPKTPEWAEKICGVSAGEIRGFAHEIAAHRTMLMFGWGMQRADAGEQPHWMMAALASVLGQIGLPGGGFGVNYHYSSGGAPAARGPRLGSLPPVPEPAVPVRHAWRGSRVLPAAAVSDCLLNPGKTVNFNGTRVTYPEVKLLSWAGGNPFSHHPDTNRLERAFRRPDTVIVTDCVWTATARMADIVLPACTAFEHPDITDIGTYTNGGLVAMHQTIEPLWESKNDYDIWADVAEKLGIQNEYTCGLGVMDWVKRLYEEARSSGEKAGTPLPEFREFWDRGFVLYPEAEGERDYVAFSDFRADPEKNRLGTESGKIQLFSPKIAGYGYEDCGPHPRYMEPVEGVPGKSEGFPLALVSGKSRRRLHSQLDCTAKCREGCAAGREPVWISPADAEKRGIRTGDLCEISSTRGRILAGAVVTDRIRQGVVSVRHGAWRESLMTEEGPLDIHGCANTLVLDKPTSSLAFGNLASAANVEVRRWNGEPFEVKVFSQPETVRPPRSLA